MRQSILRKLALFAALSFVVHAYSQDMWDGITVASGFHAGTGTASNPFQIRTGAQLMYFVNQVNAGNTFAGKTIRLMNDIDLNENDFSCSADFAGTFDGGLNDLRVKFNKAHSLFSSVRGTVKSLRILASFNDHDGYPHYSSVYLASTLHEGAVIKDCEYVIEDGYVYDYATTFINTNYGMLQNCYTTGLYRSYGAGSYIRNGQIGMLVTNNMATGIVENCKGNTYKSGCNYEGTPLPLITNNHGTLIEGEYVSPFIIPTECTIEFIDTLYNQDFPTRIVNNGQTVGVLPIARRNWTLTGWKRGGRIVCPTDTVKDNWTLFANWEQVIRRQPTRMDMTVDVDDIDNALFQWYSIVQDTTHVEGWVSPKISDGEVTSKEISFDAESGQILVIKYDLQSEADADYFKVYLNGVLAFSDSGNKVGAIMIPVSITGANFLTLSYTKDESWGSYRDNVIVSDIMIVNAPQQVNCQARTLPTDFISSDSAYFCGISYTNSNTVLYTDTIDFRTSYDSMADTDISQLDNVIYFPAAEGLVGTQVTLSLQMKNLVQITGFQCDLYLPEGITVCKDSDDSYEVCLSNERTTPTKTNIFDCALQADGSLRILCSSTKSYAFSGNGGEVATVVLQLSEDLNEDDYPIILKNIVMSDNNSNTYDVECVQSTLTVADYTPGDVNNDQKVNVGDITGVANYILGNTPFNFVSKAADVNADGNINVGDITGIANLILYGDVKPAQVKAMQRVNSYDDGSNTISIDDVTVEAGGRQVLSVCLKNTISACGLQFDLYLPEGISIPKDEEGFYLMSLSERTTAAKTNIFECAIQPDGAYRILMGSTKSVAFTGNDGTICTITIEAAADAAVDVQLVEVKNIFVSDTNSDTYETSSYSFNLTVSEPADTRIVLNENSTTVPASATNVDVRVLRTINANVWSTICLPFGMTEAQTKEAFGEDVQLGDFTGYDVEEDDHENIVGIKVNFATVSAIEANHPYIIKVSAPVAEFSVEGVDIDPEDAPCVSFGYETGRRPVVYHPVDFIGTYVADFDFYHDAQKQALFLSGNKFYYATENTQPMKAFRAYFDFDDVLTEVEEASVKVLIDLYDEETGLDGIASPQSENGRWFDLSGRNVAKPSQRGIYIQKGKKTLVK